MLSPHVDSISSELELNENDEACVKKTRHVL